MSTLTHECGECRGRGYRHTQGCDFEGCSHWMHERCEACDGIGEVARFCIGCGDQAEHELGPGRTYCDPCARTRILASTSLRPVLMEVCQ
jgi:hypothetical protein